jgi:hypothetical protein
MVMLVKMKKTLHGAMWLWTWTLMTGWEATTTATPTMAPLVTTIIVIFKRLEGGMWCLHLLRAVCGNQRMHLWVTSCIIATAAARVFPDFTDALTVRAHQMTEKCTFLRLFILGPEVWNNCIERCAGMCGQNDRRLRQLLQRDDSLPLGDQTAIFDASGVREILLPIFDFFTSRFMSGELTSRLAMDGSVDYQFSNGTPWLESPFMPMTGMIVKFMFFFLKMYFLCVVHFLRIGIHS